MYLVNTRIDICFTVNTLSQFMVEKRHEHWLATKHVFRYLRGTIEYDLRYLGDGEVKLQGYINSNWVGNTTNKKITSRCSFILGSTMISWFSRKQNSMALSSIEEKYMVASVVGYEAIWIHKLLASLFDQELDSMVVYCNT
jgi:hypothetical protein